MCVYVQMQSEFSSIVEVDEFGGLGLYWNRLLFLKSR